MKMRAQTSCKIKKMKITRARNPNQSSKAPLSQSGSHSLHRIPSTPPAWWIATKIAKMSSYRCTSLQYHQPWAQITARARTNFRTKTSTTPLSRKRRAIVSFKPKAHASAPPLSTRTVTKERICHHRLWSFANSTRTQIVWRVSETATLWAASRLTLNSSCSRSFSTSHRAWSSSRCMPKRAN